MKRVIDLTGVDFNDLWQFCLDRVARNGEYRNALPYVAPAFFAARRANLRYDRRTHILRDDRLGELSRPSKPSEWPQEADPEETQEALCRSVWCDAVRARNLATA